MNFEIEVTDVIPASPQQVFAAWTSSAGHSAMTNSPAQVSAVVGEAFQAGDGYIRGYNLALEPPRRILQSWRTREFTDEEQDSLLEILLESEEGGTRVTIRHSILPLHGEQYRQGWHDNYFTPMKAYFSNKIK